jgi:hypothetical protein
MRQFIFLLAITAALTLAQLASRKTPDQQKSVTTSRVQMKAEYLRRYGPLDEQERALFFSNYPPASCAEWAAQGPKPSFNYPDRCKELGGKIVAPDVDNLTREHTISAPLLV